jgi:macrodomain Ter protein organizer (MatP/YcbG family)
LPRKGYRTICVTDAVYHQIQKKARESNYTIPEYIVQLLEKDASDKEKP